MSRKTLKLKKNQTQLPEDIFSTDTTALEVFGDSLVEISDQISLFTSLKSLQVISKNITIISEQLFEIPTLNQIKFKFGRFTTLPSIKFDTNIKIFFCTDGSLETLTEDIFHCPQLEIIVLSGNNLKKLPKNITLLKKLRRLVLDNNQIEEFPFNRSDFPKLNHLSLDGNNFSPAVKQHIYHEFGINL